MALNTDTLLQIESLAQLYQNGYRSATVDATIRKLVMIERTRLQHDVADLQEHLRFFEQQYGWPSDEFSRRFQTGEIGDDADWFEWSATYQMWLSAQRRIKALDHTTQK